MLPHTHTHTLSHPSNRTGVFCHLVHTITIIIISAKPLVWIAKCLYYKLIPGMKHTDFNESSSSGKFIEYANCEYSRNAENVLCFSGIFFLHRNRMEMWKIKSDWKPLNIIGSMHAHGSVRARARSVLM